MYRNKNKPFSNLIHLGLKKKKEKKRERERNSLCNAQEKLTPRPSLRQRLQLQQRRREKFLSDQTRKVFKLKKKKKLIPSPMGPPKQLIFLPLTRPPLPNKKLTFQSHGRSRASSGVDFLLYIYLFFKRTHSGEGMFFYVPETTQDPLFTHK